MVLTSASCCRHVQQDSDISTHIDMSEEQINIKTVQTVEEFPVMYDYSSPGHSDEEEVDKAWHAVPPDRVTSRALKRTLQLSTRLSKVLNPLPFPSCTQFKPHVHKNIILTGRRHVTN
jgi:hypothetical protein